MRINFLYDGWKKNVVFNILYIFFPILIVQYFIHMYLFDEYYIIIHSSNNYLSSNNSVFPLLLVQCTTAFAESVKKSNEWEKRE